MLLYCSWPLPFLLNCFEKDPTGPTLTGNEALLAGTWNASAIGVRFALTSNTTQTGMNPYAEGTGGITVTGAETITLKHLASSPEGQMATKVSVRQKHRIEPPQPWDRMKNLFLGVGTGLMAKDPTQ